MSENEYIITINHIVGTLIAIGSVGWGIIKFYTASIADKLKSSIEKDFKKDIELIKYTVNKETSPEGIKLKIKDYVDGELKLMEQDIRQIKEVTSDLKLLLSAQQETLIAIQMGISELKPKLDNLEARVKKLEDGR